jgi:hypothetical protein
MKNITNVIGLVLKNSLESRLYFNLSIQITASAEAVTTWRINFKMNRHLNRQIDGRMRMKLDNDILW